MKLHLKKFDIGCIKEDRVVVLIGKRNTGKSFLVRDLLYYHTDLPIGTVISGTECVNEFFGQMIPYMFIHHEFKGEIIEHVRRRQEKIIAQSKKETKMYGRSKIDTRAFLILDDCLFDDSWNYDKNMRFLFMNGRHIHCFLIITMQYPLGVKPNLRTNIDYTFILRENNFKNRKIIYENYASVFPTYEAFCQVMDQCTENYECLVIDNTSQSNRIEDVVYWYKADSHEAFQLCNQEYWRKSEELRAVAEAQQEEDEMFSPDRFRKKGGGPVISVEKKLSY